MRLVGADKMSRQQFEATLRAGGRLVFYEYCVSLLVVTLRCPSPVYLLQPGEAGVWRGLPYSLVSFLFGWWGLPMGLVYTPLTLMTNLSGGRDVTAEADTLLMLACADAPEA
jgi:hypothetical protein